MTPFSLLTTLAGLSHREAALVLNVSIDQVKKWSSGARSAPPGVVGELRALIAAQERAAAEALAGIARTTPEAVEIGVPADDDEAQEIGWPCVGAWGGMAARVIAQSPVPVRVVPRGSTPATAAAMLRE